MIKSRFDVGTILLASVKNALAVWHNRLSPDDLIQSSEHDEYDESRLAFYHVYHQKTTRKTLTR